MSTSKASCPCCTILVNDLFLPTIEKDSGEENYQSFNWKLSENPLTPFQAAEELQRCEKIITLVDTHGHPHLQRDLDPIYSNAVANNLRLLSISCAVEPSDFATCIDYASQSEHRIAALGVHPWYLQDLSESYLDELRALLVQHPRVIVGEIGLCKMARFVRQHPQGKAYALEQQRNVFVAQLQLAAELQRPVSVHCVQQQGVLLEILKEHENSLPPAIALHSFSGTAHQVQQLLRWEESLKKENSVLFFGFSHAVNVAMCTSNKAKTQTLAAVQAVPMDRLLAESDVHNEQDVLGGTLGAISYLAWACDTSLPAMAHQTSQNALRFLQSMPRVA